MIAIVISVSCGCSEERVSIEDLDAGANGKLQCPWCATYFDENDILSAIEAQIAKFKKCE